MVVCPFVIFSLVIAMSVIQFIMLLGTPSVSYLSHVNTILVVGQGK